MTAAIGRIAIVGASGSGKSTLAAEITRLLDIERVELDELFHRPGWEPTPTPEFRRIVDAALDVPRWVVTGNYSMVSDIVHGRTDTIVWLDVPRWLSTARVLRRSIRRVVLREKLWNGNRERLRDLLSRDPDRNPVIWSWRSQPLLEQRYEGFAAGKVWAHADVHRLRSRRDIAAYVSTVDPRR